MYIEKHELADLVVLPVSATYVTASMGADIGFRIDDDNTVQLEIGSQWFRAKDLKELRKLIKRLEAEIA